MNTLIGLDVDLILTVLLLALLLPAAWVDFRTRRIPNRLTLSFMVVALVLRGLLGWQAVGLGLLAGLMAFAFSFPFFCIRALGAGDGKLLIATGMLMGPERFLWALLAVAVFGGILSFGQALRQGKLRATLETMRWILSGWVLQAVASGRLLSAPPSVPSPGVSVPYGVAIAVGSLTAWFLCL